MSEFSKYFNKNVPITWKLSCPDENCRLNPSGSTKNNMRMNFNVGMDEEILFVRDTSFWSNRNQGLVLTDKRIYIIPDNDKPNESGVFDWNDITKVSWDNPLVLLWFDDDVNNAATIHISFFTKNVSDNDNNTGKVIAGFLNECAKKSINPVEKIWNKYGALYDAEDDFQKKISIMQEMIPQLPEQCFEVVVAYECIASCYPNIGDIDSGIKYWQKALNHDLVEYGSVEMGYICYRLESIFACMDHNIENNQKARIYALMAARFASDEEKIKNKDGDELTIKEDATIDFSKFDTEYTEHFLEIPYKDRKTLLIVDTYDNLFQNSFVTLNINSDLSHLSFPMGHPIVNELYVAHPLMPSRYMPIENYQLELIEDKVREFCELAQSLGATEIDIECINSSSSDTYNSGNTNISGGVTKGEIGASGSKGNEYSRNLIEQLSHSVSLHQEFQPHKAPVVPDNMVWYDSEPSWQRLSRQRIEGGLVSHEERIETKKSKIVNNREMNEIKGELQVLFTNMNIAFDKSEESKFEEQEDAVLAIKVKFAPISSLGNNVREVDSQQTLTSDEQAYLDEVKACMENGEISASERRLLTRFRERLGISEARAAELEESISVIQLTDDEKEYLEAYRDVANDGNVSERERRILDRLRTSLGISEERAKELERM